MWLVLSIIAGVIALLAGALGLVFAWSTSHERKASRIHRAALARCSTEEIHSRAVEWAGNPDGHAEITETPALNELRALVAGGRYREVLKRWRYFDRALANAIDWDTKEGPPATWILRDYLHTLDARSARG